MDPCFRRDDSVGGDDTIGWNDSIMDSRLRGNNSIIDSCRSLDRTWCGAGMS